ncbi:ATP-dependent DNA helicase UvrD2 [Brevibacterium litoralis]|uniref:ATP-dependent DNA helicase UvrD2 n=1 Tax=Brevibacterium litoralis TaxID=3138935 RepID=UPI0032EC0C67
MNRPADARARALLDALDPEQREVAEGLNGPMVVLAGAGTGKTRAMTHRIAYGVATGAFGTHDVLALTFTAKAAGEMRARLRDLGVPGVQARTFHSAALRQLRYFWPAVADGPFPELVTHKAGLVARAMTECGYEAEREVVRDTAAEIEHAAVSLIGTEGYAERAGDRPLPEGIDAAGMERIMRSYAEIKTLRRLLDFEDVLAVLSGVLATRPDIAAKVHDQYRHFVVDEFQDVSPLQYDLLTRWLGDRDTICVVGDPAQTIYGFAGATDSFLRTLRHRFEGARTVSLVRNYRSTTEVVEAANNVLAHTGPEPLVLRSTGRTGPAPEYTEYPDDAAEAAGVAARIAADVAAGRRPADVAVLFRTNGQSRALEEALATRGISYVLRGGERFFARREVKEAVALLRAQANRREPGDLGEVVGDVLSGIGWQPEAPAGTGAVRERWESLNALVDLAADMQDGEELPVPLTRFVEELADRAEHQFAPQVNGVTLASVHAAKGLEWEDVHLVGLTEGLLPIGYAKTPAAVAEERRLFYVALTRARTTLTLNWSQARQGGRGSRRTPSRFLAEVRGRARPAARGPVGSAGRSATSGLPDGPSGNTRASRHAAPTGSPGTVEETRPHDRARKPRTVHRCRQCGAVLVSGVEIALGRCAACPADIDRDLHTRLLRWRKEVAAAHASPAFIVLTNATLEAIAELRPTEPSALARVPGIGGHKLELYGRQILDLVNAPPTDS